MCRLLACKAFGSALAGIKLFYAVNKEQVAMPHG